MGGRAPTVVGRVTERADRRSRAGCGSSTGSTARCSVTSRPRPSRSEAPALPPPAGRARPTWTPGGPTTPATLAAPADCGAGPPRPAGRPVVGLPPVRPPAVPQHGGRPGRRRRRAPPGRTGPPAVGAGSGPVHRLQPAVVLDRPAGRHGGHRGRVGAQRRLRRGPPAWRWSTASTSATPSTPRSCGSCPRPSTAWPRPASPSASR